MNSINKLSKITLGLLVVIILLAGCADIPASTLQTAAPTIKPPPIEAETVIVGFGLGDFIRAIFNSALIAVGLAAFVAAFFMIFRYQERQELHIPSIFKLLVTGLLFFVGLVLLQALRGSMVTVPADKVGVHLHFGAAKEEVLAPGLHRITPWADQVALMSTREFTYITTSHVDTASEDFTDYKVGARTCDGVEVEIPYTIKFRIQPASAPLIFAEYGSVSAVEERVVKALSRQIVREVPTNFSSVALYASSAIIDNPDLIADEFLRELLTEVACGEQSTGFDKLNEEIRGELAGEFEKAGIVLTFFGVRQPDLGSFGEKLDEVRITAKDAEIAQINIIKADAENQIALRKAETEAEVDRVSTVRAAEASAEKRQKETAAEAEALQLMAEAQATVSEQESIAEANALRLSAEAEADAIRSRAQAEADANREIASSLTPELSSHLQTMAQLEAWDGQLPPFGQLDSVTPFLDLSAMVAEATGAEQ